MKLCKCVMYAYKYIVKNNVLSMKTEDEEDAFMKPTYYHSSLLIPNQKLIIIRSRKRLIEPHFANKFHPSYLRPLVFSRILLSCILLPSYTYYAFIYV